MFDEKRSIGLPSPEIKNEIAQYKMCKVMARRWLMNAYLAINLIELSPGVSDEQIKNLQKRIGSTLKIIDLLNRNIWKTFRIYNTYPGDYYVLKRYVAAGSRQRQNYMSVLRLDSLFFDDFIECHRKDESMKDWISTFIRGVDFLRLYLLLSARINDVLIKDSTNSRLN